MKERVYAAVQSKQETTGMKRSGVRREKYRMASGFFSGSLAGALGKLSRRCRSRKMQHVEALPIRLIPIKHALVVLRAKRREQAFRLRAAEHDWLRLRTRLARGALSVDALRVWRRRREERADAAEGQADARAAFLGLFRAVRPLVRVHAVHPARVGLEAHDEERVVRQRHALRASLRRLLLLPSIVTIIAGGVRESFFVLRVMVRRAPSERFTMRESRTTSIVLSECSDM
jgi:hypothetical protein